ncbi:MAG: gentisate 1,2-dioxygenase [Alphaproteobacteria bacterium]|nr:gentisate 1,2-dioxygenase [Alphaproteobacteria bacterium]
MATHVKPTPSNARADFYERIGAHSLAPLWEVLHNLVTPQPVTTAVPAMWRYADIRGFIDEAGELITAKEAERRVLILENPGLPGQRCITTSLFCGLQYILPGEVAPSHRHTQSALRFVIEGEGAYTAVDGERTTMRPGDFVITPSWTWHDHGNPGNTPMVWMDGLDIPIVRLLNGSFAEKYGADEQAITRPEGDSPARYGRGMLPLGERPTSLTSPVFNYPYDRTREALEAMRRRDQWDPCHGLKMQYVNPLTGGWAMPTIGTFMQLLPKGFKGAPYRSTDGTVFSVVEGRGTTKVGDQVFAWGPRDIFVVPGWTSHRHEATEDAVIFSFSDRPVHDKLGLWREERGRS